MNVQAEWEVVALKRVFAFLALVTMIQVLSPSKTSDEPPARVGGVKERKVVMEDALIVEYKRPSIHVVATHYTARCTGCTGITATGIDVRNNITTSDGYGIIATDPRVIPLGTKVQIDGKMYVAGDTGGAIKGHRIDILVSTKKEAYQRGKVSKEVFIIE